MIFHMSGISRKTSGLIQSKCKDMRTWKGYSSAFRSIQYRLSVTHPHQATYCTESSDLNINTSRNTCTDICRNHIYSGHPMASQVDISK